MNLKNAFRILTDNFSNTYKLLLYRLIMGVIMFALGYAILSLGLHTIVKSDELDAIFTLIKEFLKAVASGDTAYLATFEEIFLDAITALLELMRTHMGSIVGSLVGVCLIYLFSRYLNGVGVFAMGGIINDKMTSYTKTAFSAAYFKHLSHALLYEVIYVPLTFVYDVLAITLCWFLFFFIPSLISFSGILAVLLGCCATFALFIILQAFKLTLFSAWIPASIVQEGVIGGLKLCMKDLRHKFWERFSGFLIALYLIAVVNVVCAVATFGSFLLITVPASYIYLLCLQFVYYYNAKGGKYYLSRHDIVEADGENLNVE